MQNEFQRQLKENLILYFFFQLFDNNPNLNNCYHHEI